MRYIAAISTEYVSGQVTATDLTGRPIDLSSSPVELAFTAPGAEPVEGDWQAAIWGAPGRAAILVGPLGLVQLAVGEYKMWVRVTVPPEKPVLRVDAVTVF